MDILEWCTTYSPLRRSAWPLATAVAADFNRPVPSPLPFSLPLMCTNAHGSWLSLSLSLFLTHTLCVRVSMWKKTMNPTEEQERERETREMRGKGKGKRERSEDREDRQWAHGVCDRVDHLFFCSALLRFSLSSLLLWPSCAAAAAFLVRLFAHTLPLSPPFMLSRFLLHSQHCSATAACHVLSLSVRFLCLSMTVSLSLCL